MCRRKKRASVAGKRTVVLADGEEVVLADGEEFIPGNKLAEIVGPAAREKHHAVGSWYFEWSKKNGFGKTLG